MIDNQTIQRALRFASMTYRQADAAHWPKVGAMHTSFEELVRVEEPGQKSKDIAFFWMRAVGKIDEPDVRRVVSMLAEWGDGRPAHTQRSIAKAIGKSVGQVNKLAQRGFDRLREQCVSFTHSTP